MLLQDTAAQTTPAPDAPPAVESDPGLLHLLTQVGNWLIRYAPSIISVLAILLAAWIASGWARRLTEKTLTRAKVDVTLAKFLSNLVKYTILVLAVVLCLGRFGFDTTSLAAVIGAAGLAIGLAMQGSLTNIAAGVMLLIFRPFKVGDMIVANGQLAKVDEIELFFTRVDTPDNRRLIIPNSALFGTTVENITFHPHRRADISVGVSYSADIDATRRALERAIELTQGALKDPKPAVFLKGFGPSSVDWDVRVFAPAAEFGNVRQSLVRAIKIALDEAGISIPFPQMDVHLISSGSAAPGPATYAMARPQNP